MSSCTSRNSIKILFIIYIYGGGEGEIEFTYNVYIIEKLHTTYIKINTYLNIYKYLHLKRDLYNMRALQLCFIFVEE